MSDSLLDGALSRARNDLPGVAQGYPDALKDLERDLADVRDHSKTPDVFQQGLAQLNQGILPDSQCGANPQPLLPSLYIAGLSKDGKVEVVQTFDGNKHPSMGTLEAKDGTIIVAPLAGEATDKTHRELFSNPNNLLDDLQSGNSEQGQFGDCTVLSTEYEMAKFAPQQIKDMLKDNRDGTYTVTFAGDRKHPVTVDAPSSWELKTFCSANKGIWPAVIEKAYRKYNHKDFYDNDGNDDADMISFFTGKRAVEFRMGVPDRFAAAKGNVDTAHGSDNPPGMAPPGTAPPGMAPPDTAPPGIVPPGMAPPDLPTLQQALASRQKMHSTDGEHLKTILKDAFSTHALVTAGADAPQNCNDPEPTAGVEFNGITVPIVIENSHTYAVVGYNPSDQTVVLRNPWGVNRLSGSNDYIAIAEFKMPVSEFHKEFSDIAIGETK